MTPIDLRNATFADLQARITGQRRAVLKAWQTHGPCTTQRLAVQAGMSILTVRPRTTELLQLGLVALIDHVGTEGWYEAMSEEAARAEFEKRRQEAIRGGVPTRAEAEFMSVCDTFHRLRREEAERSVTFRIYGRIGCQVCACGAPKARWRPFCEAHEAGLPGTLRLELLAPAGPYAEKLPQLYRRACVYLGLPLPKPLPPGRRWNGTEVAARQAIRAREGAWRARTGRFTRR